MKAVRTGGVQQVMRISEGVGVRERVRRTVTGVTVICRVTQLGLTVMGAGRGAGAAAGSGSTGTVGAETARGGAGGMAMMMMKR
jgi:hypothetical protein